MKHVSKLLLIVALMTITDIGFAQRNLIPPEVSKNITLQVGDTLIFDFLEILRNTTSQPVYATFASNDYSNILYYIQGYMSNRNLARKQKKGGFVYHGNYEITQQSDVESPISDIQGKQLVVIRFSNFNNSINKFDKSVYHEIVFRNTTYNDTLIYRWGEFFSPNNANLKFKGPSTILNLRLDRKIKSHLIGKRFYYIVNDGRYDRIGLKENGEEVRFREYTIIDCSLLYQAKQWHPTSTEHIIFNLKYKDNEGNIEEDAENFHYRKNSNYAYSEEEVTTMERKWNEEQIENEKRQKEVMKNAGHYYFELTSVDKPKSQNVKRGKITGGDSFEDNIITIVWREEQQTFFFALQNKTDNTMRVLWDECVITNFDGFIERVLHKGADLDALKQSQQPSIIPSKAKLLDFVCSEQCFGKRRSPTGYGGTDYDEAMVGKQMRLTLPLQVGNTTYTYTFILTMKWAWEHPELREQ